MSEATLTHSLITLLAAGFLAWAGVVWRASSKAFTLANDISIRVTTTLDLVTNRLERLETRMTQHEALHGHSGAVADTAALRHEISELRLRHVDDLNSIHQEFVELRRGNHNVRE